MNHERPNLTVIHGGNKEVEVDPIDSLLERFDPDELSMVAEALSAFVANDILTVEESRRVLGITTDFKTAPF